MPSEQMVLPLAEVEKRDEGMTKALEAEDPEWLDKAKAAVRALGRSGRPFTSEDVRLQAGDPTRPNALGAFMHWCHKRRWIAKAGITASARTGRRGGIIGTWVRGENLP